MKFNISEIFYGLQGEGEHIGTPAVFVRFNRCNLICNWCDTKYTWDNDADLNLEQVVDEINRYPKEARLVFTGGEPLLYQHQIVKLLERLLPQSNRTVEVETNGTIIPNDKMLQLIDFWNISPKLSNSGMGKIEKYKTTIPTFKQTFVICTYKFVVGNVDDAREALAFINEYDIKDDSIFMPQGQTDDEVKQSALNVIEMCKAFNIRLIPRMHIWLYGKRRGV